MPIFHRNFVHSSRSTNPGAVNPGHLANVGPRLPVQIGIPDNLAVAYADEGKEIPALVDGYALFDTGASITCVDESVLRRLGLPPMDNIDLATPSGSSKAHTYACALYFPGYPLPDADLSFVAGAQLQHTGYVALIGRDFLSDMVLIYDGPGARVTFAF